MSCRVCADEDRKIHRLNARIAIEDLKWKDIAIGY
jgi:hypothetical protein